MLEEAAEAGVRAEHPRHAHPTARQFLEDFGVEDGAQLRAAVFPWHVDPEEPDVAHALDERRRILVAMLERARRRPDLAIDEGGDSGENEVAFLHGPAHCILSA